MDFNLIKRIKKRDAILLHDFCALKLREDSNALRETSFERVAVELNDANCLTARGCAFTAAVVRACVAELERAKVASREEIAPGKFNLTLIDAATTDSDAPQTERETREIPKRVETSSNGDTASVSELSTRDGSRARNINNKINKQINKNNSRLDLGEDSRPTVDDAVAEVDLNEPRAVAARGSLLRELYEPGLHADLFDRAICALKKHFVTSTELKAAIHAAQEEKRLREITNGFRGAKTYWQTFCLSVKSWFDAAGYRWTPTSFRREPRPKPRPIVDDL